jgi:hypothetical protein
MKLTAKDLRIGNLIYWNIPEKQNVPHEVVGIVKGKPQTIPISLGESIEDYQPIPLTEEWLLRFGFINNELSAQPNVYVFHNCSIYVRGMSGAVHPRDVQYVHQLQNLYHSLTGQELQLN